ncbi:hypothetical protein JCM10207_000724 [Rhodosporidiobolus poonsookiae]
MASTPTTGRELVAKAMGDQNRLDPRGEPLVLEFDRFLRSNPTDTEFVIDLTPHAGYGQLVCMEEDCFENVDLEPSPSYPDGGLARGFGSLIKYQEHCLTAKHIASCNKRLGNEAAIKSEAPPPSFGKSSSSRSSKTSTPRHSYGSSSQSIDKKPVVNSHDYAQPVASGSGLKAPAKKRTSDLGPNSSAGALYEDDVVDKKPKLDAAPGVFAERQNAANANGAFGALAAAAVDASPAHVVEYKNIKDKIARWHAALADVRAMPPYQRTKDDYDLLDMANRELGVLNAKEAEWRARHGAPPAQAAVQALVQQLPVVQQAVPGAYTGAGFGALNGIGAAAGALNDLAGRTMQALAGVQPNGGDDSDDDAMWRAVGPDLTGKDLDELLKKATEGEGFEGNENVNKAAEVIKLKSQQHKLKHMNVTLLPHQIIGVAWMKEQEESKHYGGILADEMGLGKTVEAIANCLVTESNDPHEKTNLLVAPVALLEQWRAEIEEKVEKDYWSVCIYHGPERKKLTKKKLLKYDWVLTSYNTLVGEYPNEDGALAKAKKMAKKEGGDVEDYLEFGERGPLLQIDWFRIILDEAQNIRNRNTQISKAVADLSSIYRWTLTGTPVTNTLGDLFPLLRFLQIKPFYEWKTFREAVVYFEKKDPNIAGRKAQAILRSCMLRRKKDSKLDGKELISLPKKDIDLHEIEFSEEEREIYTMIETRAQAKFNKFLKAGTVLKNYAHVLVLLLRLRQVCFHPSLVADAEQTLARKEEAKEELKTTLERAIDQLSYAVVNKIKKTRLQTALDRMKAEKEGTECTDDECPVCMEPAEASEGGGVITACSHVFCRSCANDFIAAPAPQDDDEGGAGKKCKADQRPCPLCRQPVGPKELFALEAFEPSDFELTTATGEAMDVDDDDDDETLGGFIVDDEDDGPSYGKKGKGKGKAPSQPNRRVIQDSDDEHGEAEEVPELREEKGKGKGKKKEKTALEVGWMKEQEPSAKMKWALDKINEIHTQAPDDKIIVISSFTTALDIFEDYLATNGHRSCRYQGDMNRDERERAIRTLKKSNKCKIMLLSLKAGGVGLTLTRANRIIALDLAWSPAVESQAFDRCHRIGQTKEVFVDRLTIANSVEQRILELQKKKQGLSDAAFGEGQAQKLGKLTVAELAGLFGLNKRGERLNEVEA